MFVCNSSTSFSLDFCELPTVWNVLHPDSSIQCMKPFIVSRSPVVPDLIDIVEEWAMKNFKITKRGAKVVHMDIVWNKLKFTSSDVHFENEKFEKDPGAQELLTTSFENNSDKTQYQIFEASETSTSTATTTLEKGFTRGDSGDIVLTVPDMIRAKASHFHDEIVINEDGRKTERTRKWKGKTSFDAIARKNTIVQMMILQKEYHCDFTMTETLRGTVIVNITGKTSQDTVTITFQNQIATILEDMKELFPEYVTSESNHVVWPIKGHIAFRYGVEVKIRYWYEDLQKAVEKSTEEAGLEEDNEEGGSQLEEDAPTTVDVSAVRPDEENTGDVDSPTLHYDESLFDY